MAYCAQVTINVRDFRNAEGEWDMAPLCGSLPPDVGDLAGLHNIPVQTLFCSECNDTWSGHSQRLWQFPHVQRVKTGRSSHITMLLLQYGIMPVIPGLLALQMTIQRPSPVSKPLNHYGPNVKQRMIYLNSARSIGGLYMLAESVGCRVCKKNGFLLAWRLKMKLVLT